MPLPVVQNDRAGERLTSALRELERSLHPDVVRIRASFETDWSGDAAIFFRIVLSDAASRQQGLAELTGDLSGRIFDDLQLANLDYVPYFNFRNESEQKQLKDPEWD